MAKVRDATPEEQREFEKKGILVFFQPKKKVKSSGEEKTVKERDHERPGDPGKGIP